MKLRVDLAGKSHSYDVLIERGLLGSVGKWVSSLWAAQKIAVISDDLTASFYAEKVMSNLDKAGFDASLFIFPSGETSKSIATAEAAWNFCAAQALTRSDGIIGLGGGVVGDLAGFVASTYLRGIHFLQIATSLTAQVDSSIGGKTGLNAAAAKNMIGSFAQPDGVLIDPDVLATLDERCLREGMGEVIKCALIADAELWDKLDKMSGNDILDNADDLIAYAVNVKRKLVMEDEFDNGSRLLLNFGHTIGHALEATAGFGELMHGEAVSIGMVQMTRAAENKGLVKKGLTDKISDMLHKFGLPVSYEPWEPGKIYQSLMHDKKLRGKTIQTILVTEIGKAEIHPIELNEMMDYLKK
ncbi:MAG: 3-dehydroquinate synthase [Streptococcaceae bacterium]|jgi:3-dehydroquinate synthase|nr:3-dehydroquinate synthase [Streptococcaceae bacterium]